MKLCLKVAERSRSQGHVSLTEKQETLAALFHRVAPR